MSAADVIAEAWDAHGTYRLVGNPAKPSGWLCKCGVQCKSPAERAEHRSSEAVAALSAAGYVVATPDEIRAMSPQEQAELIGGEVSAVYARPHWHDTGEPTYTGIVMEPTTRRRLRFTQCLHVVGPWREVQP